MSIVISATIRFSILNFESSSYLGNRHIELDGLRDHMFSDSRMAGRWRLFSNLTIPSLDAIAATHAGLFHVAVLTSSNLPHGWKDKLYAMASTRPWMEVRELKFEETTLDAARAAVEDLDFQGRMFSFRIDDDDAISSEIVDVIERISNEVADRHALSFDTGFYLRKNPFGRFVLEPKTFKNIALGLGIFSSSNDRVGALDMGNHKSPKYPVINVADKPYWVRTIHSSNDSTASVGKRWSIGKSHTKASAVLRPHFPGLNVEKALSEI